MAQYCKTVCVTGHVFENEIQGIHLGLLDTVDEGTMILSNVRAITDVA